MYCFAWGGIVYPFISLPFLLPLFSVLFDVRIDKYIHSPLFPFDSNYCFMWGGIGISTFLPEPPPYLGQGYTIWYKYHTTPQLNKIRILFNSLHLYTHIYTYTTVYHCIPCIYITVYPIHLLLKPDYHTIYKSIQARICTFVYASTNSQDPDHGWAMQG